MKKILLIAVLIVVVLSIVLLAAKPKTATPRPDGAAFGTPTQFTIGQMVKFQDGLQITLVEINDSRCKPDVQCIWAGELSLLFSLTEGKIGTVAKEVRLGTSTAPQGSESGYSLDLGNVTESAATLILTSS